MSIRSRREAKSKAYHKHVIELLNAASKPVAGKGQAQVENAQLQSQVQMHELRRHTNKRGRVVR